MFAEGQRRFLESTSAYARQFVEQLPRTDVDDLRGIAPTAAIEQRVSRGSRKSTVATITEVAQYLRLLYARLGIQHSPVSGLPVMTLTHSALVGHLEKLLEQPKLKKARHLYLAAPLVRGRKGHHQPIADWIAKRGFNLMRVDGRLIEVGRFRKLSRYQEHDIEVILDDLGRGSRSSTPRFSPWKSRNGAVDLTQLLKSALQLGKKSAMLLDTRWRDTLLAFNRTRRPRHRPSLSGAGSQALFLEQLQGMVSGVQWQRRPLAQERWSVDPP